MSKPIEASIVVVDDEPSIRELLVASLHFAGFEVNTAASGSEAIEVIEKIQPDLIVLDVMLPDIDGFTVTRRIRQEGITTPVLYLTARDDTQDKVMGLTVGGDDYVTKPFSLEEVVARIRAILRRTQEQVEDDPIIRIADRSYPHHRNTAQYHGKKRTKRFVPTFFGVLPLVRHAGRARIRPSSDHNPGSFVHRVHSCHTVHITVRMRQA